MKTAALVLALSFVFLAGCQQENPGGSDTTPPSGGTATTAGATGTTEGSTGSTASAGAATTVAFNNIQPVIQENCVGCHGEKEPKEGVNLTSYASLMKGGEHGPIVVAGNPDESVLIHVLKAGHGKPQMPPKGPLPADTISKVEQWIKDGAKEAS